MVYTGYILPCDKDLNAVPIHVVILTAIGAAGTLTWAAAGGAFQKSLTKYCRPINIAIGLVLLWCAMPLSFDTGVGGLAGWCKILQIVVIKAVMDMPCLFGRCAHLFGDYGVGRSFGLLYFMMREMIENPRLTFLPETTLDCLQLLGQFMEADVVLAVLHIDFTKKSL